VTDPTSDQADTALDPQALLDELARQGATLAFNRHMGVEVREATVGRCVTALPEDPALSNHLGGVHAIAELAPVELAGALAACSQLMPLLVRGYVPVVGSLSTRFRAPAHGELVATALLGPEVLEPALASVDAGERPRTTVEVSVTDRSGTVVNVTELHLVFVPLLSDPA
jgi:acyl-coenzyme A thioesterase PaaI-like protein